MPESVDEIEKEIRELSVEERSELFMGMEAEILSQSLETDEAFVAELRRRSQETKDGNVEC